VLLRIPILLQIRTWFDKLCNYHLAKVSNVCPSYCTSS
jgi:hypothetical protein